MRRQIFNLSNSMRTILNKSLKWMEKMDTLTLFVQFNTSQILIHLWSSLQVWIGLQRSGISKHKNALALFVKDTCSDPITNGTLSLITSRRRLVFAKTRLSVCLSKPDLRETMKCQSPRNNKLLKPPRSREVLWDHLEHKCLVSAIQIWVRLAYKML